MVRTSEAARLVAVVWLRDGCRRRSELGGVWWQRGTQARSHEVVRAFEEGEQGEIGRGERGLYRGPRVS